MKYKELLITILSVISLFVPAKVFAIGTNFGVAPAVIENTVDKGESVTFTITVFNSNDDYIPITVSFAPFNIDGKNYSDLDISDFSKLDDSGWLSTESANFFLEPYKSKKIEINIKVPEDAEVGGHYSTVYFQPLVRTDSIEKPANVIAPRVGVLIFTTVKGEMNENLIVKDFGVEKYFNIGHSAKIYYKIRNEGNVHAFVSPVLTTKNRLTGESFEKIVKPQIIMPFTTDVDEIFLNDLAHGFYNSTINFSYSGGDILLSVDFVVVTWLDVCIGVTIVILLLLLFTGRYKRLLLIFRILTGKSYFKR